MIIIISPSLKINGNSTNFEVDSLEELREVMHKNGISRLSIINSDPFEIDGPFIRKDIKVDEITESDFLQFCNNIFKPHIQIIERMNKPIVKEEDMIHKKYLPFSVCHMEKYFSLNPSSHVKYYQESAKRYKEWEAKKTNTRGKGDKSNRQIEKDERFWSAQCFMNIFEQLDVNDIATDLKKILVGVFGDVPPAGFFSTWEDALKTENADQLILRFEENIPSPKPYTDFLQQHVTQRHFIPYIIDHATKEFGNNRTYRSDLEGPTNVDVLIINPSNGFNIFIEAKLLSDISYQVTYDLIRNQMARNIDAMLYDNRKQFDNKVHTISDSNSDCPENFGEHKDFRQFLDPNKSLFILLTPKMFKDIPSTRLYAYKFLEYTSDYLKLMDDLNHRFDILQIQWSDISKRLGWLTWEDINKVNSDCCPWVNDKVMSGNEHL